MILLTIFGLLLAGALVYSALSVIAAVRYLAASEPAKLTVEAVGTPEPVSILKPLAGLDEGLEENLRSFFVQEYPVFELIFAVRETSDACVPLVERLRAEYGAIPSQLIVTGEPPYPHAKVFSLARMLTESRYDLVVMSDSDIRVGPDFLKQIGSEFADGRIALATCPYRAIAGRSFWSRVEAVGMNTTFWQGVLTARMLDGMKFAVGPTIAARKKAMDAIGGLERVRNYLAEDFELGKVLAESGACVVLSSYVVEHRIGSESLATNVGHRIRWGRTSRRSRPFGYIGQIFTYPLPLALVFCALVYFMPLQFMPLQGSLFGVKVPRGWPLSLMVLAGTLAARYFSAWMTSQIVLGVRLNWLLLPLEDMLGFLFWIAGFFGNTITWRGRTYRIDREGRAVI